MTRETKIGLLVGLAFIIVIGILLSDYNRIESPNAPLYGTVKGVQDSVATPSGQAPNRPTIVYPTKPVTPHNQVPTVDELSPTNVQSEVVIRPGNGQLPAHDEINPRGVVVAPGNTNGNDPQTNGAGGAWTQLQNAANKHKEEIVLVSPGRDAPQPPAKPATLVAGKQYTAEPGDTVSKMAGRFMGANTKTNRDAIVAANPSLQKNINNVIVGRAYVIPGAPSSASVSATGTSTSAKPLQVAVAPAVQAPVNQPQQMPTHWYVVKENDSLWRIAQDQLGDGNAVAAIKELNKDVLKGRDDLRPNMKLRLPAKPLASAN